MYTHREMSIGTECASHAIALSLSKCTSSSVVTRNRKAPRVDTMTKTTGEYMEYMDVRRRTILREAEAGLQDKGDLLVRIEPDPTCSGIKLELRSKVMSLFGEQIRKTILEEFSNYSVVDAKVVVDDHGALDYAIRARVQAAIERATREEK